MEAASALNGWVNTRDSDNPKVIEQARKILKNNLYCTLSTCSRSGRPWVSPVFFAYDRIGQIYWVSAIASLHSQNIHQNLGQVAIAIFDSRVAPGTGEGLYFYGTASELSNDAIEEAIKLLEKRAGKQIKRKAEDFFKDAPRKIYQFQAELAWVSGDRIALDNHLIDTKIKINSTCKFFVDGKSSTRASFVARSKSRSS